MELEYHAIVLFDGVCHLCNRAVQFILDRDPKGYFAFAPLQSERAQVLLASSALPSPLPDSVILIQQDVVFTESTAALRIAGHLRGLWPVLTVLLLIPRPLRDTVYRFIARHRYRWFGRSETCHLPRPEIRNRFLR